MKVCTVIGHVVSNSKHPLLEGKKIMVVRGDGEEGGDGCSNGSPGS